MVVIFRMYYFRWFQFQMKKVSFKNGAYTCKMKGLLDSVSNFVETLFIKVYSIKI